MSYRGTLIIDTETYDGDLLYTMPPEKFVRISGYKWKGDKEVTLTTDLEEIRSQIRKARWIIGHNIISFDLQAIFGHKSNEWLEIVDQGRVLDTFVFAALVHPAPSVYTNRFGKAAKAEKPAEMMKWFGLDEQAHQLGVKGKTQNLDELVQKYGGFDRIPVDDPTFRDYLRGDVLAHEAVAKALLKKGPLDAYAIREMKIWARMAVISSNGWRVDKEKAEARVAELAARRDVILRELEEKYGLPSEGKSPWATDEGKTAIMAALADYGITPKTVDWPKTPAWANRHTKKKEALAKADKLEENVWVWRAELESSELPPRSLAARERWIEDAEAEIEKIRKKPLPDHFGLSMSGETLKSLTADTPAADLGQALAELKGQRTLAQLALDSMRSDGFVHPTITMLQRSGRASTTNPGLTIWTERGPGRIEKSYFIPDREDHVLLEIDYSNADARVVAALSGDRKYAEGRFEEGADSHLINAWAAWGKDVVGDERDENGDPTGKTKEYRQKAKALGHGWNYGGRAKTLSQQSGVPLEAAEEFVNGMDSTFKTLVAWQNRVRKFAARGYVVNDWGRKMYIEEGRAFTQAPALLGQSGTREIACDFLLKAPYSVLRSIKAFVHDAFVFSVPENKFEACRDYLVDLMSTKFKPKSGGQLIDFPVSAGPPGKNWMDCAH